MNVIRGHFEGDRLIIHRILKDRTYSKKKLSKCLAEYHTHHMSWKDDYNHWKNNGFVNSCSKPFPIEHESHKNDCLVDVDTFKALTDPSYYIRIVDKAIINNPNETTFRFFFDDNAKTKSIVHFV